MLSPASLRVCCLAVMAPALTKADRRADCLPVVLPEPFYFSKTADTFNSEDNNNHISFSKFDFKTAWRPSHRKSYMNKVWLRSNDRTKHVISSKLRYSAIDIRKHWAFNNRIGINVSPKCKPWQYTKGFAALADKLRLKYTMNKNNLTNKNMGLANANASLGLQDLKKMRKISQLHLKEDTTILESDGESSPDLRDSTNSDFRDETLVTVVSPVAKDVLNKNHLTEQDCDVFSPSSSLDGLQLDSFSQSSCLRSIDENQPKECQLLNTSDSEHGAVATSELKTSSVVSLIKKEAEDTFGEILDNCPNPSSVESSDVSNEVFSASADSQEPKSVPSQMPSVNISEVRDTSSCLSLSSLGTDEILPNPVLCNFSTGMTLSGSPKFYEISDASHMFCAENITNINSRLTNQLFDVITWEQLLLSRKQKLETQSKKTCCNMTFDERESISKLISGKEERLKLGILQFQLLKCKQMNLHVGTQIQNVVGHFQKKLGISCQMQVDPSNLRPEKEMVDIKAEILQSENVKSLSTAALVNLVRNIESNTIPEKLLTHQKSTVQDADVPSDKPNVFDPEDVADIKHTSSILRNSMKKLLRSVDSDMTDDSSDEESSHGLKNYELALDTHSSHQKKAIWKCLAESASLHSRSSWLIARIQELEYQLGSAKEKLKETINLDGDVCFEESASCNDYMLSTNDVDEQFSTKQASLKNLIRPVNGYLDHSSVNDLTVNCSLLESNLQLTASLRNEESCSRTRPLKKSFQKRKIISVDSMPNLSSKASKFSTVSCYCNSINGIQPCVLCAGRYNSTQSVDPDSMTLQDRIALLDPIFHPVLSSEKEIPLSLHFENTLKLTEAQYQTFQPASPVHFRKMRFESKPKHYSLLRNHSRKLNRYTRSLLSVKYRNKHVQNSKHLRKHRSYFGKWRRLNRNKHSFHSRERIRRYSVVSSASSHDSPVPSPLSIFDDGSGLDYMKKRRDDDQFDIDDVILPLNSRIGRAVEILKYKDITCPSWRCEDKQGLDESEEIEEISNAVFIRRHDRAEIEERKQLRSKPFGLNKRARRHRCDSRAESSGANTPDPVLLYNQDFLFQVPSLGTRPSSPALSPPTTPSSTFLISDDSQPSLGNGTSCSGLEKRKLPSQKRSFEEAFSSRSASIEYDEVQPYLKRVFPLADEEYAQAVLESVHPQHEDAADNQFSGPSCPASPDSYTYSSSTSTVEEENDDIADPEWTVHKNDPNSLVLKLSKR